MKIAVFFSCHNIYRTVKKNRTVSFFQYRAALLQSIFLKGLNEAVKDCLVGRAGTKSLQKLIALAIKVDNGLRERRREREHRLYIPLILLLHLLLHIGHLNLKLRTITCLLLPQDKRNPCSWVRTS